MSQASDMALPPWMAECSDDLVCTLREVREALAGDPPSEQAKFILQSVWAAALWELHEHDPEATLPLQTMAYTYHMPGVPDGWLFVVAGGSWAPHRPSTRVEALALLSAERAKVAELVTRIRELEAKLGGTP